MEPPRLSCRMVEGAPARTRWAEPCYSQPFNEVSSLFSCIRSTSRKPTRRRREAALAVVVSIGRNTPVSLGEDRPTCRRSTASGWGFAVTRRAAAGASCRLRSCSGDGRVYWGVVLLVVTALRQQRLEGFTAKRVEELFGIRRPTLDRWMGYFREVFPRSRSWQRVRGRVGPAVMENALPSALVEAFVQAHGSPEQALPRLLSFLTPDGS